MKRFFVILVLCLLALNGCSNWRPLVYKVNKSEELRQYESEQAEEAKLEEELRERSDADVNERQRRFDSELFQKPEIEKEKVKVRGIYLSDLTAGNEERMAEILRHIDATELNAVVIDIKNDDGQISYEMDDESVREMGAEIRRIRDMPALLKKLHRHRIYVIARLTTFRDPYMENRHPEWMNQLQDGSVFHDESGNAWVNPYQREYWNYMLAIAKQCARDGFDEIQLDYVRFCAEKGMSGVSYEEPLIQGRSRTDIITEFVQFMSAGLASENVFLSADVFGTIISSYDDSVAVGQDYSTLSGAVDYLCPMIYPSHYQEGSFGIDYPDMRPYDTIKAALYSSQQALILGHRKGFRAQVRPWLQAFTASYLSHYMNYDADTQRQQIQAVYDSGLEEWIMWNASNRYNWDAFQKKE